MINLYDIWYNKKEKKYLIYMKWKSMYIIVYKIIDSL